MIKVEFYKTKVWPKWIQSIKDSPTKTLFIHGILGSELFENKNNDVLWVDIGILCNDISKLEAKDIINHGEVEDKDKQFIYARDTVKPPNIKRPYSDLLNSLKPGIFCYDWRDHIPINAEYFGKFLDLLFENNGKLKLNIITHSMGGCILLWYLSENKQYDDKINKIIFCAPPFYGSLLPLQIIEYGNGLDGIDEYIPDFQLRNTAATLPGLNDLLIAPKTIWPTSFEFDDGINKLLYPIRTNNNIYTASDYTNQHNPDLHAKILNNSNDYYKAKEDRNKAFIDRFKDKTNIIVGLNGKTPFAVEKKEVNEGNNELIWKIAYNKSPSDKSKINNGDGVVLFQSSYLKGLPKEKYFACIPKKIQDTHSELMDNIDIINGLKNIINDKTPSNLYGFNDFFPKIDWSNDTNSNINFEENLTYEERNKIRSFIPKQQWNKKLNPNNDAETFCLTRRAAINVLNGANLKEEAKHINQNEEFLYNHIKKMLFPML